MEMYSTRGAARQLGISVRRVQLLCKEGRLKATRLDGGDWIILDLNYTRKRKVKGVRNEER